jgi:hypothetical protein
MCIHYYRIQPLSQFPKLHYIKEEVHHGYGLEWPTNLMACALCLFIELHS